MYTIYIRVTPAHTMFMMFWSSTTGELFARTVERDENLPPNKPPLWADS